MYVGRWNTEIHFITIIWHYTRSFIHRSSEMESVSFIWRIVKYKLNLTLTDKLKERNFEIHCYFFAINDMKKIFFNFLNWVTLETFQFSQEWRSTQEITLITIQNLLLDQGIKAPTSHQGHLRMPPSINFCEVVMWWN